MSDTSLTPRISSPVGERRLLKPTTGASGVSSALSRNESVTSTRADWTPSHRSCFLEKVRAAGHTGSRRLSLHSSPNSPPRPSSSLTKE